MKRGRVCACCGGRSGSHDLGVVSSFLSERAFDRAPAPALIYICESCGYKWAELGLSCNEAERLYSGYREENYYLQRHRHEPWYTRAMNSKIGSQKEMVRRRSVMMSFISQAESLVGFRPQGVVFDYGGDRGQMLRDFPDDTKIVYELSGVSAESGVSITGNPQEFLGRCDLVLSCQVLEHVNDPLEVVSDLGRLLKPRGWAYIEVPEEKWNQLSDTTSRRWWISWCCRTPLLLTLIDFLSTAFRVKFGWIPPFGFVALREHINYFSINSLLEICKRGGLEPVFAEKSASGLSVVAIKP